jgi:hypothetical protein
MFHFRTLPPFPIRSLPMRINFICRHWHHPAFNRKAA